MTQFDNGSIDFEKAKKEFKRTNKYTNRLERFDSKCVDIKNIKKTDYTTLICSRLIRRLESGAQKLEKEHNVKRNELLTQERKDAIEYWKAEA